MSKAEDKARERALEDRVRTFQRRFVRMSDTDKKRALRAMQFNPNVKAKYGFDDRQIEQALASL